MCKMALSSPPVLSAADSKPHSFSGLLGRRRFLGLAVAAVPYLKGCSAAARPRVVIIGGGFSGATAARYLRQWDPSIAVTLINRQKIYLTCPFSNYIIGGFRRMRDIRHDYRGLAARGVDMVYGTVLGIDHDRKRVRMQDGESIFYDRLLVAPGIDMIWDGLPGYDQAAATVLPHAWEAGPQTLLLTDQLRAMEDGGLVIITVPEYPYRCPPAPYERAACIAYYLSRHKPRSKILILDDKNTFTKKKLFIQGWNDLYPGMIEWVPRRRGGQVVAVEADSRTVITAGGGRIRGDVVNVVPPQQAGSIAVQSGLAEDDGWCPVDAYTLQSRLVEGIHLAGDSIIPDAMPKSGFSANSQAKACAAALVALLNDRPVSEPVFANTCYSMLAPDYGISIAGMYRATDNGIVAVSGAGGVSPLDAGPEFRAAEARYAQGWYDSMTDEMFGRSFQPVAEPASVVSPTGDQ